MHFSRLSLAVAAAHILSFTAAQSFDYEDGYAIYARDAEPEDDDLFYYSARDAEPYDDELEFYGIYTRDAYADADADAYLDDEFDLYDLYARGLMDAKLPGGPVSALANGVRGVVKANDALNRKHDRDAYKAQPSFHQRTGGQFLNKGPSSSSHGSSSHGPSSHFSSSGGHSSSSHSGSGSKIVDQLKKQHGGSVFPH